MAFQTPAGEIWLLHNEGWSKDYSHVKYFSSESAQQSYIMSASSPDRILGQHKDGLQIIKDPLHGTIRLSGYQNTYWKCSYIAIKNQKINPDVSAPDYPFVYAFVDAVRYVSNSAFEVDYTVDVFQTYFIGQGNCSVDKAFIERTHTQSDNLGEHLEPEPLSLTSADMKYCNMRSANFFDHVYSNWRVLLWSSYNVVQATSTNIMGMRGGIFQGLTCNVFKSFDAFEQYVAGLSAESYKEFTSNIVSIIAVPEEFAKIQGESDNTQYGVLDVDAKHSGTFNIERFNTSIDGYTPKNKKLLCYPYNRMRLSDNHAQTMDLMYEFMNAVNNDNKQRFGYAVSIQPTFEILIFPYGYLGQPIGNKNYEFCMSISDFSQVPWFADAYKQWLGTSKIGSYLSILGTAAGFGVSLASGNPVGMAMSAMGAGQSIGAFADQANNAKMSPDKHTTGATSALAVDGGKDIRSYQYCINEYTAKRFDDFFSRYGYAINRVANVHLTNPRFNQHYIKTSECLVKGGAPAQVIQAIVNAFNGGVTFWKNEIGDYTL